LAKLDIVRSIWTICFGIGAFNHARDIWNFGWLPYTYMPMPFNAFWTALLPLDLMAATLVWLRPKIGAWLGLLIMIADVAVNSWTFIGAGYSSMREPLLLQTMFLIFVASSFRQVSRSS
jgi:hypothetical protein